MASRLVCLLCSKPYRRSKGRDFGRFFCTTRCRWEARSIPISIVYERDNATCHLCFGHVERPDASRDHIKPKSLGGKLDWANIALSHAKCNSRRGSRPVAEFREMLERQLNGARASLA